MGLSEETKLMNFVINALKRGNQLKKALIEYNLQNVDGKDIKPDIFLYLVENDKPLCYLLFEIKKRTVLDIEKIRDQYNKYEIVRSKLFGFKNHPCS